MKKTISNVYCYSSKKRERVVGAGRRFELDVKNRVIMVLMYYKLSITYTRFEFLFGLDQINIYRDIQKINGSIRVVLTNTAQIIQDNQTTEN
jgi:hypothetical protein